MLNHFYLTEVELKKLLRKLRDEKPLNRDHARLKELCRCSRFATVWNGMTTNFTFFMLPFKGRKWTSWPSNLLGDDGEVPFVAECLAGFPPSVDRFVFWICLSYMSSVYVYCICIPYTSSIYVFHIYFP